MGRIWARLPCPPPPPSPPVTRDLAILISRHGEEEGEEDAVHRVARLPGGGEWRQGRLTRTASLVLTIAARGRQIRPRRCSSARGSRCPRAPTKVPPLHHGWTPVRPAFPPRIVVTTTEMQEHIGSDRSCLWHTLDFADHEFKNPGRTRAGEHQPARPCSAGLPRRTHASQGRRKNPPRGLRPTFAWRRPPTRGGRLVGCGGSPAARIGSRAAHAGATRESSDQRY